MGLNRVETAQKIAEEARKRNPDYPLLHLLLANIHIRKRDYPALLGDLDTFLKLEPNAPRAIRFARRARKSNGPWPMRTCPPPPKRPGADPNGIPYALHGFCLGW